MRWSKDPRWRVELYNWLCLSIVAQYDGWGHKESDRLSLVYSICFWYSACRHDNSEMCLFCRFFIQTYCLLVTHQILPQPQWEHSVHRPWSPAQRRWRNLRRSWCRCLDNTAWCNPWGARQKEITLTVRHYTRSNADLLPDPVSCTVTHCLMSGNLNDTVCADPSIFFSWILPVEVYLLSITCYNYTEYAVIPDTTF